MRKINLPGRNQVLEEKQPLEVGEKIYQEEDKEVGPRWKKVLEKMMSPKNLK